MKRVLSSTCPAKHYALHDADGNVKQVTTKSSGQCPPPRDGMTWTELPTPEHRICIENGRCVPYLPDEAPIQRERARMSVRRDAAAQRRAVIARKLEAWALAQPDVQEALRAIESDTAERLAEVDRER